MELCLLRGAGPGPDIPKDVPVVTGATGAEADTPDPGQQQYVDKSYKKQCQNGGVPLMNVGLLSADNDTLFGEPKSCRQRLVSTDSSLLMVRGEMCMTVVVPGLQCDMTLVIASTGSEGLLGTEALQSCLPHQLDLRTRQLWANGQSTLQLHHQWQAVRASAYTERSLWRWFRS